MTLITRHSGRESKTSLKILLAEDNEINRELAVRLLTKRGHSVQVATNGRKVLDLFENGQFDTILMDVQMPEMDGFKTTAAIRSKEKVTGTHIPIIAMTAHAVKGDRERCLAAGMDGYLPNSINAENFMEVLENFSGHTGPVEAPSVPARPVLDYQVALSRVDDDHDLLMDLGRLFRVECAKLLGEIRDAAARKDMNALHRAAHSLKGSVTTFAAEDSFDAALKVELLGLTGESAGVAEAVSTLEAEIGRLLAALEELAAGGEFGQDFASLQSDR